MTAQRIIRTACIATGAALLPFAAFAINIDNPLNGLEPTKLYASVLRALFGVAGILALVFFVYGGILWLTSGGNPERISQGAKAMVWAALGLVAIFMSFVLVAFVFNILGSTIGV